MSQFQLNFFNVRHYFDGAGHILQRGVDNGWFTGWQYAAQQSGGLILTTQGGHLASPSVFPDLAQPVQRDTLFDCASITKSLPITLILLRLVSQGQIGLDDEVTRYLPRLRVIEDAVTIRDLMSFGVTFDLEHLSDYAHQDRDYLHNQIVTARLWKSGFKYSNYAPYLLRLIIERVCGQKLSEITQRDLIEPLGLSQIATFYPRGRNIAATEVIDGQPLIGVVHDPLARAIGSVDTGIAGLFASAEGLCKLMAVAGDGKVAGQQYIDPALLGLIGVNQLTGTTQSGLGFGLVTQLMHNFNLPTAMEREPSLMQGAFFRSAFTGCGVFYVPSIELVATLTTNVLHPDDMGKEYMSLLRHVFLSHFVGGTSDLQTLFEMPQAEE